MKMTLNDDEYRVLTLFRALPPEKREEFLNKMEEIIPWKAWVEMIRPFDSL